MNFQAAPAPGLSPHVTSEKPMWTPEGCPAMSSGGDHPPWTAALTSGGQEGCDVGTTHPQQGLFPFYRFLNKQSLTFAFFEKS